MEPVGGVGAVSVVEASHSSVSGTSAKESGCLLDDSHSGDMISAVGIRIAEHLGSVCRS